MKEGRKGLLFIMSKTPDDEGGADTMSENRVETVETAESTVAESASHVDVREALDFRSGEIF